MSLNTPRFALILPSRNAERNGVWPSVLESIDRQTIQPVKKILVDSSSSDRTVEIARTYGFECRVIPVEEFNHGTTRGRAAAELDPKEIDFVVFMSQDVELLKENSFAFLLEGFERNSVAAAYGRQRPAPDAPYFERISRNFNYPEKNMLKSLWLRKSMGLHAAFCSNAFAAYRLTTLIEMGNFPHTQFGEDMLLTAKMLLAGYKIAYQAEAEVCHRHRNSLWDEFFRGHAIGRMHRENPWLLAAFGKAESRGMMLIRRNWKLFPIFFWRMLFRYLGYCIGKK